MAEKGQLLVVIPCDFINRRAPLSEEDHLNRVFQSSAGNITENDLEAAQQLLQLSSHSFESVEAEEEGEGASSSLPNQFLHIVSDTNDRMLPQKSTSGAPAGKSDRIMHRRQLTAKDTTDDVDCRARRRYRPISHIYNITRPTNLREGESTRRPAKKRKSGGL